MPTFTYALPVSILKEGQYYVAYTPALDISTSADTFEKAKERFGELVQIFFEELSEKGTTDKVLGELGWQKIERKWSPPVVIANESQEFTIPVFA